MDSKQPDWEALQSKVLRFCRYDEDVAQDVMLKLLDTAEYQDNGKFYHWLSRVCANARKNHIRQQKPTSELPDNYGESSEAEDINWEAISDSERYICTKIVEGYTYGEIAESLSISTDALKKRIRRIRQRKSAQ